MSRTATSLLALLGLAALTALCAAIYAPRVEHQLGEAARLALAEEGLAETVTVQMDGRDALVSADDPAIAKRAALLVGEVYGIRRARATSRVGPAPALTAALNGPFELRPLAEGGVALYGTVPSATVRDRLMAAALRAFPGAPVRDGLAVDSTADGSWAEDAATAMLRLRTVATPGLAVDADGAFRISGRVETEAAKLNTITRLAEIVEPREVRDSLSVAGVPMADADSVPDERPRVAAQAEPRPDSARRATPPARPDSSRQAPARREGRVEVQDGIGDAASRTLAQTLQQRLGAGSVTFEAGSDRLTPGSTDVLRRAAAVLKAHPDVVLELQGHADPSETGAFDLSARRARAAKRILTEAGVPFAQVEAAAYSDSTPLGRDGTPAARAHNRRVVLKLLRRQ